MTIRKLGEVSSDFVALGKSREKYSNMEDNYVIPVFLLPFWFWRNINIELRAGGAEQCQPSINWIFGPIVDVSGPHAIV